MCVIRVVLSIQFLCAIAFQGIAQDCPTHAVLLKKPIEYEQSVANDTMKKMVDLFNTIPGLRIRMPYATKNNFTGVQLYPKAVALLRTEPAMALAKVQAALKKRGLGLNVFDAYRPFSVTCLMWRKARDRHYVANPMKASKHNRGLAVDITLIDLATGKELDMGTSYDSFTDSAHHSFPGLSPEIRERRRQLKTTMQQCGFTSIPSEWWHYNWPDKNNIYEALDLSFSDFKH